MALMQQQEDRAVTDLVRQAAGGDHRAYARLVRAHTGLVRSIVYAETLSAEDVDALIKYLRKLCQCEGKKG